MKTVIVLAVHGAPPKDFPQKEAAELFGLHARFGHATGPERAALERRHEMLEEKMRVWPRTGENDPFHAGSYDLAEKLGWAAGLDVIVGFNEFCAPDLYEAFDQAVRRGAERVIVATPMMTRGGEHSEIDIPNVIETMRKIQPGIQIVYAWPFDAAQAAQFLAAHVSKFINVEVSLGS